MQQTILIADDDPELRSVLRLTLEQAGYAVADVEDGKQAIAALTAMRFDLVITDLMMPERDGLELLEFLRYLSVPPRIMAISGAWDGVCLALASKLGAQAVLPKPWRKDELLETVRSLIGVPKASEDAAISAFAAQIESA